MPDDIDVREALHAYTSTEPPPTFSLDEVRSAGRRARRRRLALVSAAAAVTIVTGAVVTAVSVTAGPQVHPVTTTPARTGPDPAPYCRSAEAAGPVPADPPKTVVNDYNGYRVKVPREPREQAIDRLTCYWMGAVAALLPADVKLTDMGGNRGEPLVFSWNRFTRDAETGEVIPGFFYDDIAVIERGPSHSMLNVSILPATRPAEDTVAQCREAPACTVRTGPDGQTVTLHAGQSGNLVTIETGDNTIHVGLRHPDDGAEPFLSIDQLATLGEAPEMTLFP